MQEAAFANSGSEANEAAIKLARYYAGSGNQHAHIITMDSSTGARWRRWRPPAATRRVGLRAPALRLHSGAVQPDRRGARRRRRRAARGGGPARGAAGRRRHPAVGRRLPAGAAPALHRARLAADDRRSAVRHRPQRQVVRAPMGRHPTRRDDAGQGGRRAHRRHAGGRPRRRRADARQPRHHLRRRPAGLRGRAGGAGRHRIRKPARQCPRGGRAPARIAGRRAGRHARRDRDRTRPDAGHRAGPALRRRCARSRRACSSTSRATASSACCRP